MILLYSQKRKSTRTILIPLSKYTEYFRIKKPKPTFIMTYLDASKSIDPDFSCSSPLIRLIRSQRKTQWGAKF